MQSKPHTTSNSQKMAELQATKNVDRKWSGSCYTETETAVVVVRPDGVEALQTVAVVPAWLVDTHRVTSAGRDAEGTLVYVCKRAPNAIGGSQYSTTNSRELSRGHHKQQGVVKRAPKITGRRHEGTKHSRGLSRQSPNNRKLSRGHQKQQDVVTRAPNTAGGCQESLPNNRKLIRGHQKQQDVTVKRTPKQQEVVKRSPKAAGSGQEGIKSNKLPRRQQKDYAVKSAHIHCDECTHTKGLQEGRKTTGNSQEGTQTIRYQKGSRCVRRG